MIRTMETTMACIAIGITALLFSGYAPLPWVPWWFDVAGRLAGVICIGRYIWLARHRWLA